MPECVGERLLDDPVGRDVDARRQVARLSLDDEVCVESGIGDLVDQLGQAREARRRGERQIALVFTQHAEQAPHLVERPLRGVLDGVEGLERLVGTIAMDHPTSPAGLDDDQAERMSDHVVELPGDPDPFLGRRTRRCRLLLGLEPDVATLEQPRPVSHPAHQATGRPGRDDDQRHPEGVVALTPPSGVKHRERDGHEPDREPAQADEPLRVRAARVEARHHADRQTRPSSRAR